MVGASLWAARRVVNHLNTAYAFPRYNDGELANANSASAALNKWLKPLVSEGCVVHSFRHSMRDRLRAVECPKEIIDIRDMKIVIIFLIIKIGLGTG